MLTILLCCGLQSAPSEPLLLDLDQALELRLYSDQRSFLIEEPIVITVIIHNGSDRDLKLPYFSFEYPGRMETVEVAAEETGFVRATSSGMCHWPSLFPLAAKASHAFQFTLNHLGTPSPLVGKLKVRVRLDIGIGPYSPAADVNPKHGSAPEVPVRYSSPTAVSSDVLEIEVHPPTAAPDREAFEWLEARRAAANFFLDCRKCFCNTLTSDAEPFLLHHAASSYAVHARNQQGRWAISELEAASAEAIIARLESLRLGVFMDDRLLEAYQRVNMGERTRASLQPLLKRLVDAHSGTDGYQRAKALGLL